MARVAFSMFIIYRGYQKKTEVFFKKHPQLYFEKMRTAGFHLRKNSIYNRCVSLSSVAAGNQIHAVKTGHGHLIRKKM